MILLGKITKKRWFNKRKSKKNQCLLAHWWWYGKCHAYCAVCQWLAHECVHRIM